MQVNRIMVASSLVKIINVLRDDGDFGNEVYQFPNRVMSRVGARLDNLHTSPLIPAPAETWVGTKCLSGRQFQRMKSLPQACQGITKCGDTTVCRYSSPREYDDMLGGA